MDDKINDKGNPFLSRWSRLKRDARVAQAEAAAQVDAPATAGRVQQKKEGVDSSALPQLPPVDGLTMESDFSGFLHPKVGEDVKRAALKKLFSDPHFNVMDGLDTYIDDYSKPDPLPAEMLAQMRSAQKIFKWARNELEEGESAPTPTPSPEEAQAALAGELSSELPIALPETMQLQALEATGDAVLPGELVSPALAAVPLESLVEPAIMDAVKIRN